MCREGYTGNGYHCTKANGKRSNAGQLAIQVMLPLLTLLIIVSIVTTCIVYWRHKHQNRRARFIHYKFDVESKVDLAYDPGILDFSASFTVHSSMGSILHKLNYEQEIPMTAIRDKHMSDGYSTATTPLCDEGDDSSNGLGSVDNGGEDNTSISLTNEDEDLTSPRPLNQQIYSNGENDSNSSGGSQALPLRQHGSVSTATNSSFTGYICETIDMPRSFTFSSNAAVQICSAQDGISTPSSSTQTTKHPVQKEDEVIPVLIIHDENQCPTLHSTSTTSTGYISSDHSPASSIISTHTLPKNEATPTENRSPVSNYDAGTTDATPITPSPPVHVLTTINPQPQRVTSNISLNVITDLEQAFPQMSRFSSGESLDQDLPPPPSLSHLHTGHRTYSQTNLYCYNTGSVHPYENLKTETSLSRPLSHHDITAPFAKTATMSNPRHVDTLYVHSIHTQSGSEHNIPACQTSEPHTPPRVSSSINVYTSTRSGGKKSTVISLKRDKDTIMELSSRDTPSLSSYVNHESAHQLSPHHNSVVVGEECTAHAVNTHSQEDDSEALLQAECQDSVWNEAPDQQQDRVTYSYTCDADNDDGNGFAYSSIHGNVYSATHVENSHNRHPLNRSSTSGFRNILFSLSSEMNN
jgi:hypothetical protein